MMSRSLFIGLAAIAGVAVAPMAMADEGAIIVSGPRVQNSGEAKVGVHPTRALVSQVTVPTHDLDLRTNYGRSVLDHRVKLAAAEVCSRLDDLTPVYGLGPSRNEESAECRLDAQKSAHLQVRAAHWAAG
jgi:UrcA family protein